MLQQNIKLTASPFHWPICHPTAEKELVPPSLLILFRFEITSAKHATEATWNRGVNYFTIWERSKTLLDNKPTNKEHEKKYFLS
jgi:hypothetical protein